MKTTEINRLIEQMTGEIATRQDMLAVLQRMKEERAQGKGEKGKGRKGEREKG